jgi:hypothetical protein
MNPVIGRNLCDIEGVDALQAANVVAVLLRVGTPLMMRMDAAHRAKVVLGCARVELVDLE